MGSKEEVSDPKLMEWAKAYVTAGVGKKGYTGYDSRLQPHVRLVSASMTPTGPSCTYHFHIDPEFSNFENQFHGGAMATLFDNVTTVAMCLTQVGKKPYYGMGGVSRNLDCTFVRPAKVGTDVLVRGEVVSAGKRLVLLRGVMTRASDGAVVATCTHDRAVIDPPSASKL